MMAAENDKEPRQAGTQPENSSIKAVGSWLKAAREERGESLHDISQVTRIGKVYLEAIEEGILTKLPSPAYTRAFIRLYATHLGLSPDEAMLILERNPTSIKDIPEPKLEPDVKSTLRVIESPPSPRRNRLFILLLILCSAAALFIFSPSMTTISPENPASSAMKLPLPAEESQKAAPEMTSVKSSIVTPAVKNGEAPVADGIVLRLKAVRDGRIHITIDGAVSQEYDLVAGDLVEWKADKTFLLDTENAASVEGELNGVPMKPFGEQGKPAHLLINGDGVRKE